MAIRTLLCLSIPCSSSMLIFFRQSITISFSCSDRCNASFTAYEKNGLPSVKYFADKICLSSNYFGDMVKKETGKTPQEHIQTKVIELAKEHIADTEETVSQIAYALGFQYPQHLCRLFKKRVGCTPNEYRNQIFT